MCMCMCVHVCVCVCVSVCVCLTSHYDGSSGTRNYGAVQCDTKAQRCIFFYFIVTSALGIVKIGESSTGACIEGMSCGSSFELSVFRDVSLTSSYQNVHTFTFRRSKCRTDHRGACAYLLLFCACAVWAPLDIAPLQIFFGALRVRNENSK